MPWSPLNRQMVRLAVPTIVMNISTPLLGAVDTAVVGHLPEVTHLGAVSLGSLMFTMIYWLVGFFRMSTVGLTAQAHGRGDTQACADLLGRALLLALAVGAAVIAMRAPISAAMVWYFDASSQVEQNAQVYFGIRVLAAPAAFVLLIFQGWFYGVQNVAYPVAITVLVNVLNVALDFAFVVGWGYASDGVAWATVIAQYAGVAATLLLFAARYRSVWRRFVPRRIFAPGELRALLALNSDIFLRTLSLQVANLYFLAKSAALGDLVLAANTILLQLRYISAYGLDGFATAAEVTVGTAIGAGDRIRLLAAIRIALGWGLLIGAALSALYLATSPWWPAWFTGNKALQALVYTYFLWVVAEPLVSNLCFIIDGVYVGATATRWMRNAMVLSVLVVFLPAIEIGAYLFGNHGMWAATLLLYVARTASLLPPLHRLWRGTGASLA